MIELTDRAVKEINHIVEDMKTEGKTEKLYLRLKVCGGGCQGFSSKLDLDPTYNEQKDHKFHSNGVDIVVDSRSYLYANEVTIDFVDDLTHRGFDVKNHAASTGKCGCGSSM